VTSGEEALKLVTENLYDVMVVDVKMPGMGGAQVLASVRDSHPSMPVILLTGHGGTEEGEEHLLEAACAYLYKPINIAVLIDTMKSCVGEEQDG
jgi:DNA-binding NtrC family response regulator